ncbi:hypothetical protein HDV00_009623 [Rhizophlyctis rosea]|nr:hypothetical protein HDV00_009623 [Rhizophlyctis rosea]
MDPKQQQAYGYPQQTYAAQPAPSPYGAPPQGYPQQGYYPQQQPQAVIYQQAPAKEKNVGFWEACACCACLICCLDCLT